MSSIIRATTTSGLQVAPDNSGSLQLQTNGTTAALTIDTSQNVGIGTTSPVGKLDIGSGNLNFSSTAQRITGDFSNATVANRVIFQSSTTNGNSAITAMPNGTATTSSFQAFNTNDPANTSATQVLALSTESSFRNAINGTGTYLPMTFYTGGSERMRIDSSGNFTAVIPSGSTSYPAFWCRAWVNFNGQGTVAIRSSGNVSSITDNGTGQYTINFTTNMPDANYAVAGTCMNNIGTNYGGILTIADNLIYNNNFKIFTSPIATTLFDPTNVCVSVFR